MAGVRNGSLLIRLLDTASREVSYSDFRLFAVGYRALKLSLRGEGKTCILWNPWYAPRRRLRLGASGSDTRLICTNDTLIIMKMRQGIHIHATVSFVRALLSHSVVTRLRDEPSSTERWF